MDGVSLRKAGAADIPYIMATERLPGYEQVLGRFAEERHLRLISDPTWSYHVADGIGFVIFNELDDRDGNYSLKRFAVERMSSGLGSILMPLALDWLFSNTAAHRLWLHHIDGNEAAHRLYAKFSFQQEGRKREAVARADGSRADLVLMSILRPEWAARR